MGCAVFAMTALISILRNGRCQFRHDNGGKPLNTLLNEVNGDE